MIIKRIKRKKLFNKVVSVCIVCVMTALYIYMGHEAAGQDFFERAMAADAELKANSDDVSASREFMSDYHATVFNNESGMDAEEINALIQTSDGYLWAGSYSGIMRFDGKSFERFFIDDRINSVRALYSDNLGRLWIGTNDCGIFVYDCDEKEVTVLSTEEGIPSNMIRAFCEMENGTVLASTSMGIVEIDSDLNVRSYAEDTGILNVTDMKSLNRGRLAGVTNSGVFFILEGESLRTLKECENAGESFTAVEYSSDDKILVGSSEGKIYEMDTVTGMLIQTAVSDVSAISEIKEEPALNGFFICGDGGINFYSRKDGCMKVSIDGFSSAISGELSDDQGNFWFYSDTIGIARLSQNPFSNCLKAAKLQNHVVNSVCEADGLLYLGCDDGILVIDGKTYEFVENQLSEAYEGRRVRQIMYDSSNNMWISSYGELGLRCIKENGEEITYSSKTVEGVGDKFRFVTELSDGSLVASGEKGLVFIENYEVTSVVGVNEGIDVQTILTVNERDDGSILAGSDGGGIYVIKNKKLVKKIGEEEGLDSQVVLRIIRGSKGWFYVTSNLIYYEDADGIRALDNFPHNNNYDIYITAGGKAWVLGSNGIYITDEKLLISNGEYRCELLNKRRGLDSTLSANSWNYVDQNGNMYLCCSNTLMKVSTKNYSRVGRNFNMYVSSVMADGTNLEMKDGIYNVPAETNRLVITPAILNYSLTNPTVHMYLEGFEENGEEMLQSDIISMVYTNLPAGNYRFHIQIIDEGSGRILKEQVFEIHKDYRFYERSWFKFLMAVLVCLIIGLTTWMISRLFVIKELKDAKMEADAANRAKSRFLANMSHEIRTPINTIIGMNQMILRENKDPDIEDYAENVERAGKMLLELVNDVLDFSTIESGSMEIITAPYYFRKMVSDCVVMLKMRASKKGLILETAVSDEIPDALVGDEVKTKEIITNLLSNAIKYTSKGSVKLQISGTDTEAGYELCIKVTDTGSGISEDKLTEVFESFKRIDLEKNREIEGTGLGLSITRQLVEKMGGRISVESEQGVGSVFTAVIIHQRPTAEETESLKKDESGRKNRFANTDGLAAPGAKVLIVDDNKMNLLVAENLLKRTKVDIRTCSSGSECIDVCRKEKYDLIFMDHMMPPPDGMKTLAIIKGDEFGMNCDTPVILLTANASPQMRKTARDAGFADYISKPIIGDGLENAMFNVLPDDLIKEYESEKKSISLDKKQKEKEVKEKKSLVDCQKAIDFYCGGNKEVYNEILKVYLDEAEENFGKIRKLLEEGKSGELRIVFHSLKGNSGTIGADSFRETAAKYEQAVKNDDLEFAAANIDEFFRQYAEILEEVKRIVR